MTPVGGPPQQHRQSTAAALHPPGPPARLSRRLQSAPPILRGAWCLALEDPGPSLTQPALLACLLDFKLALMLRRTPPSAHRDQRSVDSTSATTSHHHRRNPAHFRRRPTSASRRSTRAARARASERKPMDGRAHHHRHRNRRNSSPVMRRAQARKRSSTRPAQHRTSPSVCLLSLSRRALPSAPPYNAPHARHLGRPLCPR
ncbi:uncharacterized protein K452DRAFT_285250 [Aplosporella prunicola CBS 121167]|uniref:Uncharacterized protein n=1 Tax=Aplosporella prunicola CBS 121167 TaxID=1176127 RepID=A0A6A6BK62_9PEZI|nr:uncharacterized protein K452DRAFT_285250 [Aplosporella prunicola CBS 121167]KAF2144038.1 hypothetical protein K452DRAFT_285250 [Aplosporella prunicola CBS 121167]